MRRITTNCLPGSVKKSNLKFTSFITAVCCFGLLFISTSVIGQITDPFVQCTNGCTANDIQIKRAYLVEPTSPFNELSSSFQCQGNASVKLALDLTTKTPRVGVYVFARIVNHTTHATVYATVGECFSTPLATGGTTKVVFNQAISWPCGTQIDLIDVFIGWGTGNTDFCAGSSDPRCPATPSKCYSLPPGEYITIQIPTATNTSIALCETTLGGGTASFDLTSKNSTVTGGASGVSVNWWGTYSGGVLSNFISTPAAYVSGSKTVYAKVKNNADTTAYSVASVALTVNPRPTAVAAGDLLTCTHTTANLTGTGSTASGVTYTWTGPGTITNSSSINATTATGGLYTLLVTNSTTGCTATATASVSINTTVPTAAAAGDLITCSHTTASLTGTGSTASGVTYLWSGSGAITNSSSINATTVTGGLYTLKVTNTTSGCTATATASVSSNTTAPTFTVCLVQPTLCSNTAGSVTVNAANGSSFMYKLNSGTPQSSNVFSGLGGGSVSSITVISGNGCSTTVNCADLVIGTCVAGSITQKETPVNGAMTTTVSGATVKAYPNPFSDRVKFVVNAPTAGNGALEIYNVMGQKVKTVYQGRINAGNQTFQLTIPKKQQETLIYMLRVDGKKVTGKLLQLNN
jgi:hypothetical protein